MEDKITYAEKNSFYHRSEILNAEVCGSYYCRKIFNPILIKDWTDYKNDQGKACDTGRTVLSPYYGIDAVIAAPADQVVDHATLMELHKIMFWDD